MQKMLAASNALAEENVIKEYEKSWWHEFTKENDNSPKTKPKVTEDCYLNNREFTIAFMNKFKMIQENQTVQWTQKQNQWIEKVPNQRDWNSKTRAKQEFWSWRTQETRWRMH